MMKVYRVEREKYIETTLTGIGASMTDGFRWNSLFTRLVYTSESRALAMLKVFVHMDLSEDLPADRILVEIFIPDDVTIQEVKTEDLPKGWDAKPPAVITQAIGDDFVIQKTALILKVPSCIVPDEYNYLINPYHEDISMLKILSTAPLTFDNRLGLTDNFSK